MAVSKACSKVKPLEAPQVRKMAGSDPEMVLSVAGHEMVLTEATLLPMVMQELRTQYPRFEPSSEHFKVLALQQTHFMLQELQKDSSVTSGMMQKLTIQDSPAASKSAAATSGQQQQEPVALYSAGYASGMEKGGFSADKPSEPPFVNKLSPRMQQTWTESPRMQLTGRESPRMQLTGRESPRMQLTQTESPRMQSTRTESPQMQLTWTESHGMQLPQTEQRHYGDPVLAPTYQASSSRLGQQLNSHTHPSSAVSTSLNAGANQGLGTKPGSTARGKPLYEKTPCKEKPPGESLKATNPNSVQGKERRGWETTAAESSLTGADIHYAGHLIMEENWDDECDPFPKCYVGNFKPAKTIFSSCDRAEDAEQPKCQGASGRCKPVFQSQAPGRANPSSRGRKWQETKQGCDKVLMEGNCHQDQSKPQGRQQWVKVGKQGKANKRPKKGKS